MNKWYLQKFCRKIPSCWTKKLGRP